MTVFDPVFTGIALVVNGLYGYIEWAFSKLLTRRLTDTLKCPQNDAYCTYVHFTYVGWLLDKYIEYVNWNNESENGKILIEITLKMIKLALTLPQKGATNLTKTTNCIFPKSSFSQWYFTSFPPPKISILLPKMKFKCILIQPKTTHAVESQTKWHALKVE